jgi:hypothetical protein
MGHYIGLLQFGREAMNWKGLQVCSHSDFDSRVCTGRSTVGRGSKKKGVIRGCARCKALKLYTELWMCAMETTHILLPKFW